MRTTKITKITKIILISALLGLSTLLIYAEDKMDSNKPKTIRVSKEQLAKDEAELLQRMNTPEAKAIREEMKGKQNLMNRCTDQLKTVCKGKDRGPDCQDKGLKRMDSDCQKMVSGHMETLEDQRKDLVANCQEPIMRLCPLTPEKYLANPNQGNKDYKECLIRNKANFHPNCAKSLGALWATPSGTAGGQGAMAKKNPCAKDYKKYCPYNQAKARKDAGAYMIEHQRCINRNKHFFSKYCQRHLKNKR